MRRSESLDCGRSLCTASGLQGQRSADWARARCTLCRLPGFRQVQTASATTDTQLRGCEGPCAHSSTGPDDRHRLKGLCPMCGVLAHCTTDKSSACCWHWHILAPHRDASRQHERPSPAQVQTKDLQRNPVRGSPQELMLAADRRDRPSAPPCSCWLSADPGE